MFKAEENGGYEYSGNKDSVENAKIKPASRATEVRKLKDWGMHNPIFGKGKRFCFFFGMNYTLLEKDIK